MSQVDVPWVAKSHFRGVVVGWDSECSTNPNPNPNPNP